MSQDYMRELDKVIVEKGNKQGSFWLATLTTQEVLDRLDFLTEINRSHHMYLRRIVDMHYPGATYESIGINGENGWVMHVKVRSK